jgi:agmatinase
MGKRDSSDGEQPDASAADRGLSPTGDQAFTAPGLYGSGLEYPYSGALSFMRRRYTRDCAGADVVVCGVPCDLTTSARPGARFGPRGIRAASSQLAWGAHWPWGFDPFDRLAVVDAGDVTFEPGYVNSMLEATEAEASRILAAGASMLALGGDHLISLPLLRAHAARHGPLALVHFDAHTDTWSDEPELGHGNMFYHALGEGLIDVAHSVQVGIRTHNDEDHDLQILDADWVQAEGASAVSRRIREVVGEARAYLTFDIDCLDPAYAPGTGTPVVGGLSTGFARQVLRGLEGIDFVGMDIVEVAPPYDVSEITSLAAATLALDYLCLIASSRPGAVD